MIAWNALAGGMLIGLAATLLLFFNGKILGISGIVSGILRNQEGDRQWRYYFLAGCSMTGLIVAGLWPGAFEIIPSQPIWRTALAGILVGFGTSLGSGCTSGHGVCGISRLSPRSILATVVFMLGGIITVFILRRLGVPL